MTSGTSPRAPTRRELSSILKDARLVKAFEQLFAKVPSEFISQQDQLDTVFLVAESAGSQSMEAVDAVTRLAEAVEKLSAAPAQEQPDSFEDLSPKSEGAALVAGEPDGAGVSAGTLNNAPSAGDPVKWLEVDDNGTTRYIPSW